MIKIGLRSRLIEDVRRNTEETSLHFRIRKERRGSYNGRLRPIILRQQSCRERGIQMHFLFDDGSCDTKPLFLRDRANVLIWSVAILDIDDDDVIVGWDVYLLVEGGLRGRILPWYNCTSLLIVPDAG